MNYYNESESNNYYNDLSNEVECNLTDINIDVILTANEVEINLDFDTLN